MKIKAGCYAGANKPVGPDRRPGPGRPLSGTSGCGPPVQKVPVGRRDLQRVQLLARQRATRERPNSAKPISTRPAGSGTDAAPEPWLSFPVAARIPGPLPGAIVLPVLFRSPARRTRPTPAGTDRAAVHPNRALGRAPDGHQNSGNGTLVTRPVSSAASPRPGPSARRPNIRLRRARARRPSSPRSQ